MEVYDRDEYMKKHPPIVYGPTPDFHWLYKIIVSIWFIFGTLTVSSGGRIWGW